MSTDTPLISIVTPSYNQGRFLEEAIHSVLEQSYRRVEYVIVDGGSTDGSVEIIQRHGPRLAGWVSEPDHGQYDAINKGFAGTQGEIMAWLNADDKYLPWTFAVVAEIFSSFPEVEWITSLHPLVWDERGRAVACAHRKGFSGSRFFRGENLPGSKRFAAGFIQQESTFWRRSLWERTGKGLDTSLKLAADFDLWARFFRHASLYGIDAPLGGFRMHSAQKTAAHMRQYLEEAHRALIQNGGRPGSWFVSVGQELMGRMWPPSRFQKLGMWLGLSARLICRYHVNESCWKVTRIVA
jgi:glycosyltransferase involved in cell wall biosynthesis